MAEITSKNFARQSPTFKDGDVITGCNLSQEKAHTVISTAKNLKFVGCNLRNVEMGNTWTKDDCLNFHADIVPEPDTTIEDAITNMISGMEAEYGKDAVVEKVMDIYKLTAIKVMVP